MCLLSEVLMEKLLDDAACGQKVFPPRSPLLKAEAGEPQMFIVQSYTMCSMCPVRCTILSASAHF